MNFAQIFADNALYLQKSKLTVRGDAAPLSKVTLSLIKENTNATVLSVTGNADANGFFAIEFFTPEASFDTYSIKAEAEGECASFGGILLVSSGSHQVSPIWNYQTECATNGMKCANP